MIVTDVFVAAYEKIENNKEEDSSENLCYVGEILLIKTEINQRLKVKKDRHKPTPERKTGRHKPTPERKKDRHKPTPERNKDRHLEIKDRHKSTPERKKGRHKPIPERKKDRHKQNYYQNKFAQMNTIINDLPCLRVCPYIFF